MRLKGLAPFACLLIFIPAAIGCVKEKKQTPMATLTGKVGTVSLVLTGKELEINAAMQAGDRIMTGEKSMATLRMGDNSLIRVFEKSEFTILRQDAAADNGGADTRLGVSKGRSMFIIEKLAKGDRLSVKTTTAVAAVRGTTFTVEVKDTAAGEQKVVTDVKVLSGTVYVEAKDRPLVNSLVKDGEMIALSSNAVVDDKKPIPEKTLKELKDEERDLGKGVIKQSETEETKKDTPVKADTAPPVLKTEAAIKEYYHKLEEVNLDDGTVLVGAVIFQNTSVARIHTAGGVIQVPTGSIKTIRMK